MKRKIIILVMVMLLLIGGTYAIIVSGIFIKNGSYLAETMDKCINNVNFQVNDLDNNEITGTLFPSANASKGIKSKISISVNHTCDSSLMESFYLHLNNNTSNKYIQEVSSHCENPNTLEALNNYQTPESCIDSKNYWITNGTALKYAVYDNDTATGTPLNVGYLNSIDKDILVLEGIPVTSETDNYYVFIWLDGYLSDNSYADLSLSGNIQANVEIGASLYETIKSRLDTTKTINFAYSSEGRVSTNGSITESQITNGVYLFDGSDGTGDIPIYYYRGAVTDNNVLFNNICWKIVRTTGTGGVKLIYNGTAKNNNCVATGSNTIGTGPFNSNISYVGYIYDSDGDGIVDTSSSIKLLIDLWYKNNILNVNDKIEDTIWCNDIELSTGDFSSAVRRSKPQLICSNESEKLTTKQSAIGNKLLDYSAALLSLDEIRINGLHVFAGNKSNFLSDNNSYNWWLLSLGRIYSNKGYGVIVTANGYYDHNNNYISTNQRIRPAISLKPGTTYLRGDGTSERPFVVE